jgi:mono/diheme cytochrome c family protein
MRIIKLIVGIVVALVLAGIGYAFFILRQGFTTKVPPSAIEVALARAVRNWSIPSAVKREANPYPATAENVKDGMEHFADHCAICHANNGSGDTEVGRNLYPRAPDMRRPATQKLTDGELVYIINEGVPLTGMPGWGTSHSKEDTWKLVLFIRHLPQLTPDEEKTMQSLNPKAPDEDAGGQHDEHEHHDHEH